MDTYFDILEREVFAMNSFERLEDEACRDGIEVISHQFRNHSIRGLYCDGTIGINKSITTTAEKSCVLAEELGHHYTSVGNIVDMSDAGNRKQERQARLWGYNKKIGLTGIITAFRAGCHSRHEIAEKLDVTEEYLQECIDCYRDKYGVYTEVDNYVIYFIPYLAVMEKV